MKTVNLIWNIALTVAIIVIIYNNYTNNTKKTNTEAKPIVKPDRKLAPAKIVFVNSDTLMLNYDFFKKVKKELEAKQSGIDADLNARANLLQNEITSYQKTAHTMTQQKALETERDLSIKQQELELYRADVAKKYLEEERKMNEKLNDVISDYLKRYAEAKGYDYIVGYSKTSGSVLYGAERLDVTKEVLKGLNEEYNKKK
ncbi:MAG: OmpH family outer membrane protein [Microscillaceae bacterium]|nr:OmpH family outer membrane protein [Microscillaceae bacterium]MDW8460766.1 OmpH family outer membrane protein [Cytophagales bacterium]